MGRHEVRERLPDAVHRAIVGAAAAGPIRKPDFGAMQPGHGKNQRRENTIDVLNRAPGDKGKRAPCGTNKPGKQRPQCFIRDNILGARHNIEERAIGIEEISAGGKRRYPCEIARLQETETLPNPGVGHGRPRLALRQRRALLQKLD